MKKFLATIALFLLMLSTAHADDYLLNGVYETGTSSGEWIKGQDAKHCVQVHYVDANASISVLKVALEGSISPGTVLDASAIWNEMAEHTFSADELTAKQATFWVVDAPVSRVRVNITTITGATSVDKVYVAYRPGEEKY